MATFILFSKQGLGLLLNYCIDVNTGLREKICNCLVVGLLAEFLGLFL